MNIRWEREILQRVAILLKVLLKGNETRKSERWSALPVSKFGKTAQHCCYSL